MPQATPVPQSGTPTAARSAPTATEMYNAARLASRDLHAQHAQLRSERRQLQQELTAAQSPSDKQGLERRLTALDARILDVEKQLASADALVATRAGIPGVVVQEVPREPDIPAEAVLLGMGGMAMVVLLPLSIAFGIRYIKRGGAARPALPPDLGDRVSNIERGIEAVAIEVERLGEGQRFVTQLLAESEQRRQQRLLTADAAKQSHEL